MYSRLPDVDTRCACGLPANRKLIMTFEEILAQALDLLQCQGRVSYRALKRRFNLDDAYLDDLKVEMTKAQQLAIDEDGEVLLWKSDTPHDGPSTPPEHVAPVTSRACGTRDQAPPTDGDVLRSGGPYASRGPTRPGGMA